MVYILKHDPPGMNLSQKNATGLQLNIVVKHKVITHAIWTTPIIMDRVAKVLEGKIRL